MNVLACLFCGTSKQYKMFIHMTYLVKIQMRLIINFNSKICTDIFFSFTSSSFSFIVSVAADSNNL